MNRRRYDLNDEKKDEEKEAWSVLSTTVPSFLETEHARLRRKQRNIDKKDLKAAVRYGVCEPHYWGSNRNRAPRVFRYTYNDIVYIVDKSRNKEVTCYAKPLKLDPVTLPPEMTLNHSQAIRIIRSDLNSWTSHTVMVIDVSGSMKASDMWGTRCRLDSVWVAVALDYLAQRLESGGACGTDVISIITMGEYPFVLFEEVPTTWIFYNEIVKLYNKKYTHPGGPGHFLPSLTQAEELLTRNSNASCR
jgi:hypothetical protein